jgi:hypothetical protein
MDEVEFTVDDVKFAAEVIILALQFGSQIANQLAHRFGNCLAKGVEATFQALDRVS